jgi:hypothetical protein
MTFLDRLPSESLRPPWEPPANGCCWVLRHPDGTPFAQDRDDHFVCEADVPALLIDHLQAQGGEHSRAHPTIWHLIQLDHPCVELDCAACGGPKSDSGIDHVSRHFLDQAEAEHWARSQGWSTDGQQWYCPRCRSSGAPSVD